MKMKNLFAGLVATTIVASSASAFAATYDSENGTVAIGADLAGYAGQQVTVLIVEADENGLAPTEIGDEMILYIDQTEAAAGIFQNMGVKGGSLETGKTYIVRIGGENLEEGIIEEVLSLESDAPKYTLGDINDKDGVNILDANLALQYCAELVSFTDTQKLAADVNGKDGVNILDANLILQYCAELITSFPAAK